MTLPAKPRIVRYVFRERLVHALAAVSFVYLLLTGLAFWTPGLYWLSVVLGGGYLSRALHPIVGVFFSAVVVAMFVEWQGVMRITAGDREWRRSVVHYIRNDDARVPGAGRFNYGQKMMFWAMVWGTLALLVSGVVLWFPERIPGAWRAAREAAILVHAVAGLVTIGAFIVHLYMGLAVVRGGLDAILRGEVSDEWARHHHPLWLDDKK